MADGFRRAYVLRLWRDHATTPLQVMLISATQPEERRHFDTLDACFAFLRAQACAIDPTEADMALERKHCTPDQHA